ncbi:50S ribosomal protein L4 [Mesoplasma florum L1]|uniref:Large ribosomal subunit protein uL4 n=3 Tax=Mesoplasma TaxID=46239 RepID=RL4_MESFL|nr:MULTISPECIES: 50S ribosomal protein L4 [Mesoplasma]Q6F1Z3.1 RecName: Full=Large ribosomal subunit protein uL4; AltName: Full=50S ribosomal protein L4 [Mesoplasma florum L1]AAT75480.1 50S ribosomal protein L4 [Mesoplasma florum L1]AGY41196.1 LSU ribosomal protein L4p (L1e) [Mesoplasma florum W37]ATI73079.1 50S ribosomal protein L4 [Mesoplasma florum]ATI73768.1 50S ribosomal protein L4 [Mesoplasma florum]ATZ21335.1 50S ribosomal protein L4 [Mesoplasma tabanidae]
MELKVLNVQGQEVKTISLNDSVWNVAPHKQAIYDTVISQQAALRQGTKKTKTRAEVRGGGKKPWRQKGTGRARQGSIRAPHWRGGGVTFGPTPDINYKKSVNKKVRALAFKSALSIKASEQNLVIVDKFDFAKPSTKEMISVMKNLQIDDQKTLIITKENEELVIKSSSNIKGVKTLPSIKLNVFDILNATKLVMTEEAAMAVEGVYA